MEMETEIGGGTGYHIGQNKVIESKDLHDMFQANQLQRRFEASNNLLELEYFFNSINPMLSMLYPLTKIYMSQPLFNASTSPQSPH
jgi:hypothetical protein